MTLYHQFSTLLYILHASFILTDSKWLVSRLEHLHLKVGQDQGFGGVSVLRWHATPVANVLWKPLAMW